MIETYYFLRGLLGAPFRLSGSAALECLSAAFPDAIGLGLTRAIEEQFAPGARPAFAGCVEVWHANATADTAHRVAEADRIDGVLAPDVEVAAVVTGHARTVMRLAEHHRGDFVKGIMPFRRRAELDARAFQADWWHAHGPIAARMQGAVLYRQLHPFIGGAEERPRFDAVSEFQWPDVETARAAMASRQMREEQAPDAARFADRGSICAFLAREEVLRAP